jgi:hypothetical protein
MTKLEAQSLARQANLDKPKTLDQFEEIVAHAGFSIGLDNHTGDWVLLDVSRNVIARQA